MTPGERRRAYMLLMEERAHWRAVIASAPTKSQKRTANKRLAQASSNWFAAKLTPIPEYIQEFFASVTPNITEEIMAEAEAQLEPWQKAPGHMQDRTDENGGFNDAAVKRLATAGGKDRGERQSDDARERNAELRNRYPDLIGKRGAAKEVHRRELKRLEGVETEEERIQSIRTLQKIFRAPRR